MIVVLNASAQSKKCIDKEDHRLKHSYEASCGKGDSCSQITHSMANIFHMW